MFDIDRYLNPYIPASRLDRWPTYLSRWFGYRDPDDDSLTDTLTPIIKRKHGYLETNFWIFIGTFAGIILTMCACKYGESLVDHHVPIFVPSWAAGAILMFNALRAPLAQPRNTVIGTFLSSLLGVCISKLFMLSATGEEHIWIGGALATSLSSVVMLVTKTVHPPGGAAAMLPCIDVGIRSLGWYYLALQLLISAIFLGTACVFNNIALVYPMYWWTPLKLHKEEPKASSFESEGSVNNAIGGGFDQNKINNEGQSITPSNTEENEESVGSNDSTQMNDSRPRRFSISSNHSHALSRMETSGGRSLRSNTSTGLARTYTGTSLKLSRTSDSKHIGTKPLKITIGPDHVDLPPLLRLTPEQTILLEQLQDSLNTVNVISPEMV